MNYDEEFTFIYRLRKQRHKMYSIRKIRYKLEYHCTIVYQYQPHEDVYDLKLYLNGQMEGCVKNIYIFYCICLFIYFIYI